MSMRAPMSPQIPAPTDTAAAMSQIPAGHGAKAGTGKRTLRA
jgi:hypothetical protein